MEILTILFNGGISFLISDWNWRRKKKNDAKISESKRYAILNYYKLKLLELPIFLNNIISLENLLGNTNTNTYKDRIISMHKELDSSTENILSDSKILYLERSDIDILELRSKSYILLRLLKNFLCKKYFKIFEETIFVKST